MEEEHGSITDELKCQMREYGEIRLDFHFTEQEETVVPSEIPGLVFENIGK